MTDIYIILILMLIAIIGLVFYYNNRLRYLEGLAVSTANVIMDMLSDMDREDMRLIDANRLKNELHKLLVYGVLKEDDLNFVNDIVDQSPTVFEFRRHEDAETESDNL